MKKFLIIPLVVLALGLSACESVNQTGTKQKVGAVSGAVVGGLLGSKVGGGSGQLWATGAGAVIGGLLGSEIGSSLDKSDMVYAAQANERAQTARVGETISWSNPESGNSGTITPTREGYSTSSRYCREYTQEIFVGGRSETAVGQACQNSDGTWEVMK